MPRSLLLALSLALALTGCDIVQQKMGIEDPAAKAAKLDAEGKAVGGACRHSGRAIEDCYSIYHWLPKAPIFEGWQEMDTYMRTNKIESVEPQLPPPPPPAQSGARKRKAAPAAETAGEATNGGKPEAAADKPAAK